MSPDKFTRIYNHYTVYGDVSSVVEPRVVIPAVMGSIPIRHPIFFWCVAQLVEHCLDTAVVEGSSPFTPTKFAPVAQLVEHVLGKDEASSSILLGGTSLSDRMAIGTLTQSEVVRECRVRVMVDNAPLLSGSWAQA